MIEHLHIYYLFVGVHIESVDNNECGGYVVIIIIHDTYGQRHVTLYTYSSIIALMPLK
jgi:hypothetical protein